MTNRRLGLIWFFYYFACITLAFLPNPEGALYGLCVLAGLGFFIPGGILLYRGAKGKDRKLLTFLRNISFIVLVLTVTLLLLNFASVILPKGIGDFLYILLVLSAAPMVCCRVWILALLAWSLMLTVSIHFLKKKDGA